MAATGTTKKGRPSKAEAEKKRRAEQAERERRQRAQNAAILLFAVGAFLTALTFIPGEKAWSAVQNALFGVFGVCSYVIGPVVLYVAVRCSMDKLPPASRLWKILLLVSSASGAFYIFGAHKASEKLVEAVKDLYAFGAGRQGGGALSALFGWSVAQSCGYTAAYFIIILLLIISLMLVTEISVADVVGFVSGRAEKLREKREREKLEEVPWEEPDEIKTARSDKFNVDVPLEPHADKTLLIDVPLDVSPDAETLKSISKAMAARADVVGSSKIDIPLGPDFKPDKSSLGPAPAAVRKRYEPLGPAADIVNEVFEREEKINSTFADFAGEQPSLSVDELVRKAAAVKEQQSAPAEFAAATKSEFAEYTYPPATLLQKPSGKIKTDATAELRANAELLVETLASFGVKTRVVNISRGPAVTRYELQPEAGVRISRIVNLADDIALNLAASGVRIEAPIPGKAALGIEIPNKDVNIVNLRSVIETQKFANAKSKLTFALGMGITGETEMADLAKMPHLLIAGSTGMGKSVCINSLIVSLVYKASPEELQLILIDPKIVEFNCYSGLPHLYVPVVTDPHKAAGALGSAVGEMLKRYKLFSEFGARNIEEYNGIIDKDYPEGAELPEGEERPLKKPSIVIVIDELADLMMTSPREVEDAICRIAQMGRAAGIHLVVATQRPSVDVITGVIKNNIPTRIAFAVSSQVDSRTILDGSGAEKLLGRGDMLFLPVGSPKPTRIQGCYISQEEVDKVVSFLKRNGAAQYNEQFLRDMEQNATHEKGKGDAAADSDADSMLEDAIEVVVEAGQASTSLLQRRLRLGYARAARIMDDMEGMGIIGPADGSKPRQVLMTRQQWQERLLRNND